MKSPFNIGVFDFETDPFKKGREPKPFACDLFYDDIHTTFWDGPDQEPNRNAIALVQHLLKNAPRIWYAHNGGKFDFHLILDLLPRKYIRKCLCIGGRIVQIKFENGMELRDSYALIPRGLREWSKDDIDYKKLEKEIREKNKDEIIRYLKKDCEYLSEMLHSFIETYGVHLTLASAAFKILHKKFEIKRSRISEGMDSRFRRFYFAGRVEFYQLGNLGGGFKCIDVNSSFPWSMTKGHWEGADYSASSELPSRNLEQSFIHCACESHGAFPFREEDGSVSFPADGATRKFFVTGWEWVAALELGLLVNARVISAYTPFKIRSYKDYVQHFYKIKSAAEFSGNKGERLFAKLLMNSGYGKFGMDPREHEEIALCDFHEEPDESNTWSILKDDEKNGITIYKRPAQNGRDTFNNVCVAASITGCSRALLLRAKVACDGVVYCDTDSLIARDIDRIALGSGLGEWKLEAEFEEFHIGGKKLYAGRTADGKWKTASKGAKLTSKEICRVAQGETVEYEFDAPSYSIRNIKSFEDGGKPGATKWLRFTKRKIRRADQFEKR